MSKTFADCIVAVTGASTGLGRAIAQGAAARGAEAVIINYHANAEEADETAALVEEAGAKAVLVRGDVGDDEDCKKIAAAAEPFGRIGASQAAIQGWQVGRIILPIAIQRADNRRPRVLDR